MPARRTPTSGRLGRHLTWVIAAKLAAIFVIYLAFFSPAHRVPTDPGLHIAGPTLPHR